jgi:hypothetical protein
MRVKWYSFLAIGIASLLGISIARNWFAYKQKPVKWRIGKSLIEVVLILLIGEWLPAILAGWAVVWATRPVKDPMAKVVLASVFALVIGTFFMEYGFELVLLLSLFSVDLITGINGFTGHLKRIEQGELNHVI